MKTIGVIILIIFCSPLKVFGQGSALVKINKWLTDNHFAIRQTFDGSKNENKPASLSFQNNHKTTNDYLNVDLAIKLFQVELLKNKSSILLFYPKVEWHKSDDSTQVKNKLDGGVNFEYIPFGLKSPNLPRNLPNKGLLIAPWFNGISSYKRNFIDSVNEVKLAFQLSLVSNYRFLPGSSIRDSDDNFRARYYPYFGFEYYYIPDFISKGVTEKFSTYFVRIFVEIWIIPQTLQFNIDGTYREIITDKNSTSLNSSLPALTSTLYLFPGKQESLGIGYEYKHGYDNNSKFQLVQISSIKFAWKI